MMTNLFSSFDPSTSMNLSFNWISSTLTIMCIPSMYWMIPSRMNILWIKLTNMLNKEFKILLKMKLMMGSTLMMISLFSFIMFNNLLSMFPYIFPSNSHLVMTLTLSLPMWLTFMIYGWMNNTIHMLTHLVPQGTPTVLMPFMVCIETISNIIRPMTLSVRLTANMIAGHLLMNLMGNTSMKMSSFTLNLMIMIQLMLLMLEFSVSLIQSYVFAILSTLYSSEVN
uniref:ATP synthase subunit a n=1 Tax=Stenocladius sp. FM17 TaxID=2596692 RepID=A0A5C0Q043_9COLE|nr:ATP synthase F0 subunit 6 [Stenocladius sp. FM17]